MRRTYTLPTEENRISAALIDDVALAREIKRGGHRIWLGHGDRMVSKRRYAGFSDVWEMSARTAYVQLGYLLWRTIVESAFDVIAVGLGAMGSATAYHLSKRNTKVLGLEAFIPAHEKDRHTVSPESFDRRISKILPMFRSYYELTSFGMSCKMKATRTS
jgi:hypothetical protein